MASSGPVFSEAQYSKVLETVEQGMVHAASAFNSQVQRMESVSHWIPVLGGDIAKTLTQAANDLHGILEKIKTFVASHEFALFMWEKRTAWIAVGQAAGHVSSEMGGLQSEYSDKWSGSAGAAYQEAVSLQPAAVNYVQAQANSMSTVCAVVAQAGLAFYTGLASATLTFIGAIGDLPEDVDPWKVASTVEQYEQDVLKCYLAVGAALGTQSGQLTTLAEGSSAIPGGRWPASTAPAAREAGPAPSPSGSWGASAPSAVPGPGPAPSPSGSWGASAPASGATVASPFDRVV